MQQSQQESSRKSSRHSQREPGKPRHRFFRRLLLFSAFVLAVMLFCYDANNRIEITEYEVQSADLPSSFEGFRIVQLSDLHNKIFRKNNQPLLEKIRACKPDVIFLTGDFIDMSNHTDIDAALLFMSQIPEIAPCYYIYGNHEISVSAEKLSDYERKFSEYGVKDLNDRAAQISSDQGETISVLGLNDISLATPRKLKKLSAEQEDAFQILLAHEPQYFSSNYAKQNVDLVFSGHAHGGQFRLPFLHRGLWAPGQGWFPAMSEGMFTKSGTTMIISRGLGNSGFPQRLFNHPEIIVCTLHCAS